MILKLQYSKQNFAAAIMLNASVVSIIFTIFISVNFVMSRQTMRENFESDHCSVENIHD